VSEGETIVVGGGLAGITAALRLARVGRPVTLLEVRPRLGGAACSVRRGGLWLDNGQHVFLRCCTAYRALLEELGATELTVLQDRLRLPVLTPGGRRADLARGRLPAPLHLAVSLARYRHLRPRARAHAAAAALALRRLDPTDAALDARTFGDWLADHRQDGAAIAALWNLIALPTLNLPAEEASLALAVKVFRTGLLDGADGADVGWARGPLGAIHDTAARRALAAAGVDVRLGVRVDAIRSRAAGFVVADREGERDAAAVVLAVPPSRAARLLPEGALDAPERLVALGASPIVNLHVAYDRAVTDLPVAAALRSPIQWVFDRTEAAGVGDSGAQVLAVSLSAARRAAREPADRLRKRFVAALGELFPPARRARVEAFHVTREHSATFRAAPGSAALRPGPTTRLPGLVLAGAWTATGWPATMESAVRSGAAAATALLWQPGVRGAEGVAV